MLEKFFNFAKTKPVLCPVLQCSEAQKTGQVGRILDGIQWSTKPFVGLTEIKGVFINRN